MAKHAARAECGRRTRAADLQILLSRRSRIVAKSALYLRRVSVRPFVLLSTPITMAPTGRILMKFDTGGFCEKCRATPFLVKIGQKCNSHFTRRPKYAYIVDISTESFVALQQCKWNRSLRFTANTQQYSRLKKLNEMQQYVHIYLTAKLLYMFRAYIAPIIRST